MESWLWEHLQEFPKNIYLNNYKIGFNTKGPTPGLLSSESSYKLTFYIFYIFTRQKAAALFGLPSYGLRLINEVSMRVRGSQLW